MNEDLRALALTVTCGLPGCGRTVGVDCVNSEDQSAREQPHYNRVARATLNPEPQRRAVFGIESPSARLLRTEAELGSALSRLNRLEKRCAELELAESERDELKRQGDVLRTELGVTNAELTSARRELELRRQRPLLVARDGGRNCLRCDREIRRGEAYELRGDLSDSDMEHVHCPDPPG